MRAVLQHTRRVSPVFALCAGLVLAAIGAGTTAIGDEDPNEGTNGVGRLEAPQIVRKYKAAAGSADSVRVSGTLVSKKVTYRIDMRVSDKGGTGSVASKGSTLRLLRIGEELYLKADAAFWQGDGKNDEGAAEKLSGMYVRVPKGDPSYGRLSVFTEKKSLLDSLLPLHGKVAKEDYRSAGGVRTIELTGDAGAGGTLDVSLQGEPYPVALERAGGTGTIRLADWGEKLSLKEPDESEQVDYGKALPSQ